MKSDTHITEWKLGLGSASARKAVFAIGDVQGCASQLKTLHDAARRVVDTAMENGEIEGAALIHVGDYIDRGPDSAHVLDAIAEGLGHPHIEEHNLRGNHDQILEHVLRRIEGRPTDLDDVNLWFTYGGAATLKSFGWNEPVADWTEIGRVLPGLMTARHRKALSSLENYAKAGDYLFVHAGIDRDQPLASQLHPDPNRFIRQSLFWMRFDDKDEPLHGRIVIHGHTPKPMPDVHRYRIGIDTGCDKTGTLTMIELRDQRMRFIQTIPA